MVVCIMACQPKSELKEVRTQIRWSKGVRKGTRCLKGNGRSILVLSSGRRTNTSTRCLTRPAAASTSGSRALGVARQFQFDALAPSLHAARDSHAFATHVNQLDILNARAKCTKSVLVSRTHPRLLPKTRKDPKTRNASAARSASAEDNMPPDYEYRPARSTRHVYIYVFVGDVAIQGLYPLQYASAMTRTTFDDTAFNSALTCDQWLPA